MTRDAAIDLLEQHIVRLLGFHPPGLDRVLQACEVLDCKAGEPLLLPGNPARQLWFIAQGSAMMAQPGPDKEEHIADLLFESDWVTDLQAFLQETPAVYRIECLEDAVLCVFSRDSFLALRRDLPPLPKTRVFGSYRRRWLYGGFSENRGFSVTIAGDGFTVVSPKTRVFGSHRETMSHR